jgi:hypothetical protein
MSLLLCFDISQILKTKFSLSLLREKGDLASKITDFTDLIEYRNSVLSQSETPIQKITLEIIDKAIENLKAKLLT